MIQDIKTVMWKEWKLLFRQSGSRIRVIMTLLSPTGVTIYFSASLGQDWFEIFLAIVASSIAALILVAITVPDSFAGEKERHTLSTLLSSRLPDRAILIGKLSVSLSVGWAASLLVLVLGFILVNVIHWDGSISFYQPRILYASIMVSFTFSMLVASSGVLVSMRASTVQDAAQMLMMIFMFPPLILGVAFTAFVAGGESTRDRITDFFDALGSPIGLAVITILLVAANIILLRIVMAKFRRGRLINQ